MEWTPRYGTKNTGYLQPSMKSSYLTASKSANNNKKQNKNIPLATLQSYFLPEIKVCLYTTETNVHIKRTLFHFLTNNINGWVSSPPPLRRNIHHKTVKHHLLLALTDGLIIINNILIMVRTYKSINQPQLQCIPKTKCQSQGQREHQTSPGKN